ncbi:Protein-S-isoprenylcysteine O-methyltransferase Ste14 [Pseudomonas sp. ok272]|uniref:methyltransferase family protein n=1 Tax=unclassified Pseudomonas TaxID=196821 RepID=UPI0008C7A187|nr:MULTISPECIES: isoprenylcysteine carboxylmethyltransferase family protein [unclassified Pseudomonas]SEM47440.1 Protein-S-isoprenylcysteine O-methyltransferase Ste14 [Pseudomonas sp. ok272]SFM19037.1 Protein-S-isoprenylcysteine O-methyltransferase Ste14 [Pseudomonas sp. ok602]
METSQLPQDPSPMSRAMAITYAVGVPLALLVLIFLPAGSFAWWPGWVFIAVLLLGFVVSAGILAKVNPVIFRARSRVQAGTKGWDKALLWLMLPLMTTVLPVGAFDAGRFHGAAAPAAVVWLGYAGIVLGLALATWAQAVNPFFEPGVRLQSERHHHVIDSGPYRVVRHPGYVAALLLFFGMALALGSFWALVPAALTAGLLVLRTAWEDQMLHAELAGYAEYARRVRWRLVPGLW